MIWSNTSFGKLKEVIVGRELNLDKRIADLTFKYFYKVNLGQDVYDKPFNKYSINYDILQQRIIELDNFAKLLENLGIKVYRPDEINSVIKFKTPTFESECTSASNVRDISLIYNNCIIETPTFIRNRYFENMALSNIYRHIFDGGNGGRWLRCPQTKLLESSIDLADYNASRDFNNFDRTKYDMAIDGAQFLRIGRDVIVNVTTYNHYLGYEWVKSLFPESNFHLVSITDNHIDGDLLCLKPGVFLVNPIHQNIKDHLPEKFKNWKIIYPESLTENIDVSEMTDLGLRLASSRGMDINVLSIDENTVIVNKRAVGVISALEKNGFTVIPAKLDNGEIFCGGIHCSTLDLVREDEYIFYA